MTIANVKVHHFINSLICAFCAQSISLLLSMAMTFIVPKLLGVEQFGYWQLFFFYSNYLGILCFGLNDGMYLRLGGKNFRDLNYSMLGSQIWFFVCIQGLLACCLALLSHVFWFDVQRQFIISWLALLMIICNTNDVLGFIFQAVNQTKIYSFSIIVDKVLFLVSILMLLVKGVNTFRPFAVTFLICKTISLLYTSYHSRAILFAPLKKFRAVFPEILKIISVGIILTISYYAGALILGMGRFVIDGLWGVEMFGKISFSLSLANFVLLFLNQVSMVLFPALRQTAPSKLQPIYSVGRNFLGILLPAVFLAYLPIRFILGLWLPQYRESLEYLVLLLPICTFDGKMQLLCSTYLKVLRKEKMLLAINGLTLGVSLVLCLISGFVLHSLNAIVVSMVISVAFRSIISDRYLSKVMKIQVTGSIVQEVILVLTFVLSTWFFKPLGGFLIFLFVYGLYLWFSKNKLREIARIVKTQINR